MGTFFVIMVLVLLTWNAVRGVRRVKKRIRSQSCTGDCETCQHPCQAKRIYHR